MNPLNETAVELARRMEGARAVFTTKDNMVEVSLSTTGDRGGIVVHLEPCETVTAFTTREGGIIRRYKGQKTLNNVHSFGTTTGRIWDYSFQDWRPVRCTWQGTILEDGLPCG